MATIPDEYMRPEMMAIGDSLYQGVRSLTIKNGLNQLSAPALVAEALGIRHRFTCPDPERPVLIDMEAWLRLLPDLSDIKDDLARNVDYWFARPRSRSGRLLFENVSVASATIADLYTQSWQTADDYLRGLPAATRNKIKRLELDGVDLGAIVQALNARFTLNPQGTAALKPLTQVDLVRERRPRRLLVNIGANNGLWEMAFEANPAARLRYKTEVKKLAQALDALPGEVEHIYFNNLALPSTVPNLMPLPDMIEWEEANKPGRGNFYATYENRFGFGYGKITGAQLKRLDERVAAANADIQGIMTAQLANPARLHFVDLAALLLQYDSKHQRRTATNVIKLANNKTLTSVTLNAGPPPFGGFRRGGTQGLDGMHPTVVGYALMAGKVLEAIQAAEPGTAVPRPIDLDQAFERDKLLTDLPSIWSFALPFWRDLRRARADGGDPSLDDDDEASTATVLGACAQGMKRGR